MAAAEAAADEATPVDIAPNDPLLVYLQSASGVVDIVRKSWLLALVVFYVAWLEAKYALSNASRRSARMRASRWPTLSRASSSGLKPRSA